MNATATITQEVTNTEVEAIQQLMRITNQLLKNEVEAGKVENNRAAKVARYEELLPQVVNYLTNRNK